MRSFNIWRILVFNILASGILLASRESSATACQACQLGSRTTVTGGMLALPTAAIVSSTLSAVTHASDGFRVLLMATGYNARWLITLPMAAAAHNIAFHSLAARKPLAFQEYKARSSCRTEPLRPVVTCRSQLTLQPSSSRRDLKASELAKTDFFGEVAGLDRTPLLRSSCREHYRMQAQALDAAQPFDFEHKMRAELKSANRLRIAIVGFGNFGQFIAKRFVKQGHEVLATSRQDYTSLAQEIGVRFFHDPNDLCEEHPDVVVLCSSILSTKAILAQLPLQRLRRRTVFVDVLSVKEFPKRLFLSALPEEFDILCTHPMFGPESGKDSWQGLPFVFEKVRVHSRDPGSRTERFLNIFENEGCRMVEMSCEEHDRYAASSQFMTHTVGRVLGKLKLESTPINTKGYQTLLTLVENTAKDSFDLYYGLFLYNNNATNELEKLEIAFDAVKRQLFDQLHDVLRAQLFDAAPAPVPQLKSPPVRPAVVEPPSGDKKPEVAEVKNVAEVNRTP
eukprot:jgi/Mesvir1/6978/Mv09119-RA.1